MSRDSIGPHTYPSRRVFPRSTAACLSRAILGAEPRTAAESGQLQVREFSVTYKTRSSNAQLTRCCAQHIDP
jgi:hypothetical protein